MVVKTRNKKNNKAKTKDKSKEQGQEKGASVGRGSSSISDNITTLREQALRLRAELAAVGEQEEQEQACARDPALLPVEENLVAPAVPRQDPTDHDLQSRPIPVSVNDQQALLPQGVPYPANSAADMKTLSYDNMVSNVEYHFHKAVDFGVSRLRAQSPQSSASSQEDESRNDEELLQQKEEEEIYHLQSLVFWRLKVAKRAATASSSKDQEGGEKEL